MKRAIAIADRASLVSMKLLAALNVLAFLLFLAVLLMAASKARADTPVCGGDDLVAELSKSNAAAYRDVEAQAAAVANGKGRLWKLEKSGQKPSFLFGTLHFSDPRVTTLPPAAQKAFDATDTVIIETTDALDKNAMMGALAKEPNLMMFTDSTTLTSLMSPQDAEIVNKALDARGIPPFSVAKMQPWLLSTMVAMSPCELARQGQGAPVLDTKLARDGKAAGKAVEGLETATEQLRAMASLPVAFHVRSLIDTLKLGDKIKDVNETMIALYLRGEIGMIMPALKAVAPGQADDQAGFAEFEQTIVTNRNKVMAERAAPILARGNVFMAVGALHLPGPDGLVEDFRKAGYTVTVVN